MYKRNQAVQTIGRDALKTDVNIKLNRGKDLGYMGGAF